MNIFSSIKWYGVVVACVLAAGAANAVAQENDEGPFVGGVFVAKEKIPPGHVDSLIITPAPNVTVKQNIPPPMPLTDADGNTNELIIMPNYSDGSFIRRAVPSVGMGTNWRPEDILFDAVHNNDAVTLFELGNPSNARYLINNDRLDETDRTSLNMNDPQEQLHRYLVLSYPSISAAQNAEQRLKNIPGLTFVGLNRMMEYSFAPNDPYFQVNSQPPLFQWGMYTMNFPAAWDKTKGGGYVGVIDSIASMTHADISSVRSQLSFSAADPGSLYYFHGQHVTGIIAASQNNGVGVSGACPNCSVALAQSNPLTSGVAESIRGLVDRGIQTINMSFGDNTNKTCTGNQFRYQPICDAIAYAVQRDVLLVAAAGNHNNNTPDFPANQPSVLSVGGVQSLGGSSTTGWAWWNYDGTNGSSYAGPDGVLAPAKSIVSAVSAGGYYNPAAWVKCGDILGYDESGVYGDGYGSCTGTSMAAPHITALAGILRSINPRFAADSIKFTIRQSGDRLIADSQYGHGVPNAGIAVGTAILYNPKRLTPLFAFYSSGRQDYFYTTVPQMGAAALAGSLRPTNYPSVGSSQYATVGVFVSGYSKFPGMGSGAGISPGAQVWIFTTPENPNATIPLSPLYRLSWKCGDTGSSPACTANPYHTDFVYTADSNGVSAYQSVGYKLDGIEGYIYPKTITQPVGSVRLMRKYNPTRDDHAIFPESELANMTAQGYTQNSGSDWLGYVYPNLNGTMPTY